MSKHQIESILNANTYLIECKCSSSCKKKYDYARRYLNLTVHKVLFKPKRKSYSSSFLSFIYSIIAILN